jgi:hypothetical protein
MTACVLLWLTTLMAPPGSVDQARALYQAGSDAFQAGKYGTAIDAFSSARKLVERPTVLFSLAQAYRLKYFLPPEAGGGLRVDLDGAIEAYRAAIAQGITGERRVHATQHLSTLVPIQARAGGAASAKAITIGRLIVTSKVKDAQAWIAGKEPQPVPATFEVKPGQHTVFVKAPEHLDAQGTAVAVKGTAVAVAVNPSPKPGQIRVTAPDGARIQLGDTLVGRSPLARPLSMPPGVYELIVRANGRQPSTRNLVLESSKILAVDVELEPTMQRTTAWVLMGLGGALAIGAGFTGSFALDAQDEAEGLRAQVGTGLTGEEFDRYSALRDERDGYTNTTLALGISAGAALITGLVLYLFDDPQPTRSQALRADVEPAWR